MKEDILTKEEYEVAVIALHDYETTAMAAESVEPENFSDHPFSISGRLYPLCENIIAGRKVHSYAGMEFTDKDWKDFFDALARIQFIYMNIKKPKDPDGGYFDTLPNFLDDRYDVINEILYKVKQHVFEDDKGITYGPWLTEETAKGLKHKDIVELQAHDGKLIREFLIHIDRRGNMQLMEAIAESHGHLHPIRTGDDFPKLRQVFGRDTPRWFKRG